MERKKKTRLGVVLQREPDILRCCELGVGDCIDVSIPLRDGYKSDKNAWKTHFYRSLREKFGSDVMKSRKYGFTRLDDSDKTLYRIIRIL